MQSSKLVQYFKTFAPEEWSLFLRFLKSPYHNSNQKIIRLVEIFRRFYPAFDNPKFTKPFLQKKLAAQNSGQLDNLLFHTRKLVKEFWRFERLKSDSKVKQQLNLAVFENRELDTDFEKEFEVAKTRLLMQEFRDLDFHQENFELLKKRLLNRRLKPTNEKQMLAELVKHLKNYTFWEALRWKIIFENRNSRKSSKPEKKAIPPAKEPIFFRGIINQFEQEKNPNEMLLLFKQCIDFQEDKHDFELSSLIDSFFQKHQKLSKKLSQIILMICLNGLADLVRNDDKNAIKTAQKFYKLGFNQDLIFENGKLPNIRFINMINIGCLAREYDWVDFVLEKGAFFLKKEEKEDVLLYAEGYYLFHKGVATKDLSLLTKTIKKFQSIENNRSHYAVRMRSIVIRCNFELYKKEPKSLRFVLSHLEAFDVYLTRKLDITERRKKAFRDFSKILKGLIGILTKKHPNSVRLGVLLNQVAKNENLFAKNWLREKIRESIDSLI